VYDVVRSIDPAMATLAHEGSNLDSRWRS